MGQEYRPVAEQNRKFMKDSRMGQEYRPVAEQNRKFMKEDSRMGQEYRPVGEQNREYKKDSRMGQEYKNMRRPLQDGSEVQGVNKGEQVGLQDGPEVQFTGPVEKGPGSVEGKQQDGPGRGE